MRRVPTIAAARGGVEGWPASCYPCPKALTGSSAKPSTCNAAVPPPPGSTWSQGGSSSRQGPTQAVPSAATLTENFCAVLVNCRFAVRRDGISKLLQNTRQHTIRPAGSVDTHPRPRCCQLILNNHEECLEMQEQARLVE